MMSWHFLRKSGLKCEVSLVAGLAVACLAYLLLACLHIVSNPWRGDEYITWYVIHQDFGPMMDYLRSADVHPPLYYLLMKGWLWLFPTPAWLKLSSLLIGCMTVLAFGIAGSLMHGRSAGIIAALLLVMFPQFIRNSVEIRMYGLSLWFEMTMLIGWACSFRHPKLGWLVSVLSASAALYTNSLCILFIGSFLGIHLLLSLTPWGRRLGLSPRWILSASAAILLIYIPWLRMTLIQASHPDLNRDPTLPSVMKVLTELFYYPYVPPTYPLSDFRPTAVFIAISLFVLLPLHGIIRVARTSASDPLQSTQMKRALLIYGSVLIAFTSLILISIFVKKLPRLSRHDLLFMPFFIWTAALALAGINARRLEKFAVILIFAMSAGLTLDSVRRPSNQDFSLERDRLVELAPIGVPIAIYPRRSAFGGPRLMWESLHPLGELNWFAQMPDHLPECTLGVVTLKPTNQSVIYERLLQNVSSKVMIRTLHQAGNLSIYHITNLRDGDLRRFFQSENPLAVDIPAPKIEP